MFLPSLWIGDYVINLEMFTVNFRNEFIKSFITYVCQGLIFIYYHVYAFFFFTFQLFSITFLLNVIYNYNYYPLRDKKK